MAGAKFRILLIDDDESSRYVIKNLVNQELDAEFDEAANGRLGLECIKAAKPDLIFLDLAMPELDGFEVLRAIRSEKNLSGISIIVNTAKPLSAPERDFLNHQASAILSKDRADHPLAVRELRRALVKAGFDYKGM